MGPARGEVSVRREKMKTVTIVFLQEKHSTKFDFPSPNQAWQWAAS